MALGFTVLLLLGTLGTAARAQPVLSQPHLVLVLGTAARAQPVLSQPHSVLVLGTAARAQPVLGQPHSVLVLGTAARAQPVLSQPHSVLVQPGQSARLSCTLSPQYNISHFGISWYQQRPGHSLRYLLYYNSERDKHKPARTPERFSATKDLASNACILTIAAACQDDSGTYYCALSPALRWL